MYFQYLNHYFLNFIRMLVAKLLFREARLQDINHNITVYYFHYDIFLLSLLARWLVHSKIGSAWFQFLITIGLFPLNKLPKNWKNLYDLSFVCLYIYIYTYLFNSYSKMFEGMLLYSLNIFLMLCYCCLELIIASDLLSPLICFMQYVISKYYFANIFFRFSWFIGTVLF